MAGSHNLVLLISVVTMLPSIYSNQIQRLPYMQLSQNAGTQELSHSSVVKYSDSPSSQEGGVLYLDRIGQRERITMDSTLIQPDSNGPIVPESCKHSYCEEVINYPEEAVSSLIATLGEGVSLQVDKLDQPDFTQRVSIDGNIELCEAQETLVYPKAGIGYDNKQHFLVNGKSERNKVQGFRVQSCLATECQCNRVVVGYQDGYRGRCKQFYVYRTATAFIMTNSTHAEQYQVQIKLPGYCACIAEPCIEDCDDMQ
ncbi:unnamed protein product [Arctia plantaginis]|uniref:Spaetzle domain-containing protein n=1 Tax=Arctia plantaginis TaxID=874455 RepID=A0A8S0Z3X0_ARCPL|nr:unnamed protein product [Arctia plantaginis]